jgi:hypothetical protein
MMIGVPEAQHQQRESEAADGKDVMVRPESDPGACPVSAPHCIHLLAAGSGVTESHRYGTYIGLCHALLLPGHPQDRDQICPQCHRGKAPTTSPSTAPRSAS